MAKKFKFIDNTGAEQQIEADNPQLALSKAKNKAPTSGVQEITDPVEDIKMDNLGDTGILGSITPEEDNILNELINQTGEDATDPVDEDEIRRKNLKLFQSEIDAVNDIYTSLISDEKSDAADRLGGGRALQNRQGLIGSARGVTQKGNIVARNKEAMNALLAEKALKIQGILGNARQAAIDEIAAERAAKQSSADDYLSYIELQDERKANRLNEVLSSLVSQGITLDELEEGEINELSKTLKVTPEKIRSSYATLTASDTEEGDGGFTLGSTQIRFDKDGNIIARGSKVGGGGSSTGSTQGTDTTGGNTVEVLSYEEFKSSPEAQAMIDEAQNTAQQSFTPERREELLKAAYDDSVSQLEASTGAKAIVIGDSEGDLTPTNERDLNQAGLSDADTATQSFFLNLPNKIKDEIQRGVAAGIIQPEDLTIEEMEAVLNDDTDNDSGSEEDTTDPFDF